MKKISKKGRMLPNYYTNNENDEIFDPEDNLYNNVEQSETLSFVKKVKEIKKSKNDEI